MAVNVTEAVAGSSVDRERTPEPEPWPVESLVHRLHRHGAASLWDPAAVFVPSVGLPTVPRPPSWAPSLDDLAHGASHEAVQAARTLLESDRSDRGWAEQIGPSLTAADAARLLGREVNEVRNDPELLVLHNRDGSEILPVFQFRGRDPVPGLSDVLECLRDGFAPLTIASWLTARHSELDEYRPIDALDLGRQPEVVSLARRFARHAG